MSVFDFEGHLVFHTPLPSSDAITAVSHAHSQVYFSVVSGLEVKQYSSVDWRAPPKTHKISGFDTILQVSSQSSNPHFLATQGDKIVIGSTQASSTLIETSFGKNDISNLNLLFTESHCVILETQATQSASESNSKIHFIALDKQSPKNTYDVNPPSSSSSTPSELTHLIGPHVVANGAIYGPEGRVTLMSSKSTAPAELPASNAAISSYCPSSNKCFVSIASGEFVRLYTPAEKSFDLVIVLPIAKTKSSQSSSSPQSQLSSKTSSASSAIVFSSVYVLESSSPRTGPSHDIIYLIQRLDWSMECGKTMGALQKGGKQHEGDLFWRREEALSSPIATLVVDIPAQVHDSLMKDEGGLTHMARRWSIHFSEILDFFVAIGDFDLRLLADAFDAITSFNFGQLNAIFRGQGTSSGASFGSIPRKDEFGFAKLLIAVTKANTVVCYHSLSKSLLWSTPLYEFEAGMEGLKSMKDYSLLDLHPIDMILSQVDSDPHGPIIQVLGHLNWIGAQDGSGSKSSSPHTFSVSIHALTGRLVDFKVFPIAYTSIITPYKPQRTEKTPLFLIHEKSIFLDPSTASALIPGSELRFYLAQRDTGVITGYKVTLPLEKDIQSILQKSTNKSPLSSLLKIDSSETWQVVLGSPIDALVHNEVRTISPGKVVGVDRSVLPKYLNPNAIAVATTHTTEGEKGKTSNLQVTIVDTVTGNVIHRLVQRGAIGSPYTNDESESESLTYLSKHVLSKSSHPMRSKMVFNDDWIVFSYWSTRSNRFELMSVEMFEAEANFASARGGEDEEEWSEEEAKKWSSQPKLDVRTQTFILMGSLRALAVTKTHLGISVQDVLMVYQDGKTSQISIKFLDPRRPLKADDDLSLPQYYAYIPLEGQTVINYYSSVARVQLVKTSPSALESSSIVWLSGLDSFVRLLAQKGQSFDRLSHDYSFLQIGTICIALGLATYILKSISKRKDIREKWK